MTLCRLSLLLVLVSQCNSFIQSRAFKRSWFYELLSTGDGSQKRNQILDAALAKMEVAQRSDFFESSSSLRAFHKNMKSFVNVGESNISGAGKGLFASKNIKSGTIVCLYPVHSLGVDLGDTSMRSFLKETGKEYVQEQNDDSYVQFLLGSRPLLEKNVADLFDGNPLFVDADPMTVDPTGCWVASYVNDGAIVEENSESGIMDYYVSSASRRNCVHIPFGPSPIVALITTRKVKKGKELYTSYGCMYWLDLIVGESEEATEITEAIVGCAGDNARDVLKGTQSAQATYGNQLEALTEAFGLI